MSDIKSIEDISVRLDAIDKSLSQLFTLKDALEALNKGVIQDSAQVEKQTAQLDDFQNQIKESMVKNEAMIQTIAQLDTSVDGAISTNVFNLYNFARVDDNLQTVLNKVNDIKTGIETQLSKGLKIEFTESNIDQIVLSIEKSLDRSIGNVVSSTLDGSVRDSLQVVTSDLNELSANLKQVLVDLKSQQSSQSTDMNMSLLMILFILMFVMTGCMHGIVMGIISFIIGGTGIGLMIKSGLIKLNFKKKK